MPLFRNSDPTLQTLGMNPKVVEDEQRAGGQTNPGRGSAEQVPAWKRVLDLTLIFLSLPIVLLLGFTIGLIIRLTSPGPVLFKQKRIGLNGKPFMCLKFRTMKLNSDSGVHQTHLAALIQSNQPMVKLDRKGDPRLIRGGAFIRSTGLDELPQLINVVKGEMSLVGPRPCISYEFEHFLPHQRRRCDSLPGITGLWQVKGKNRTTFEQMIDLDLEYVRTKSLGLDLRVVLMTVPAILIQAFERKMGRVTVDRRSSPPPVDAKEAA